MDFHGMFFFGSNNKHIMGAFTGSKSKQKSGPALIIQLLKKLAHFEPFCII